MAPEEQHEKHPHIPARHVIDKVVLGGSDGVIEGIATTAVLNGAGVDFRTILLAGFAFAIAGALSMFFSNYLSGRSVLDSLKIDIERERMEIETEPEEERKELEGFLKNEGYAQKEVDVIMNRLTKDKDMWLRAQLRHELHLHMDEVETNPVTRSAPAGGAFFLAALAPVLPYLFRLSYPEALTLSLVLALAILFTLGSMGFFSLKHFSFKKGAESALVGAVAALLLYLVGRLVALV